ncbi:MAG TPA: helix-turn-helix domain-containing protein [Chloroflexi bacterium]|nr:helix-turn-helix domain-containing protein [Chloroflexota bacterium]
MPDQNRTVGEILKTAREEQGLSLEEISLLTKVNLKYLSAIEADNWDVLPSIVQQKGFVRTYARVLEIDPGPLLGQLRPIIQEDDLTVEPAPPDVPDSTPAAEQHPLEEIGSILKTQREHLGFTIPNVEDQIFIPERYLIAIENGSLEELPSTVQGKGMVKNYAQFLGLDPEPLLLGYADVLQKRLAKSREGIPDVKTFSPLQVSIRRFLASPTILWVGVVILIGSITLWAGTLIFGAGGSSAEATATIPGVSDILLPTSTLSATPEAPISTLSEIEVDITPTLKGDEITGNNAEATPTLGITGNEKVQVQLIILQRTWVRVIVDNILAYEGRLLPGSVKLFGGELSIEVLTGNAAGVEVIYNQRDLGAMGLYGEVIDRVFTAEGIATPTPTISATPTPSDTPEASITPTPTATQEPE